MDALHWSDLTVLITGGTGSFGKEFVKFLLREKKPKKVIVFSRDELKQHEMQQELPCLSNVRFFLGDIRDKDRLMRAFYGVDVVVHAAALKQVPACEYNPFEAIQTNIIGSQNIIDAAITNQVKRVLAISTDKAVNPNNLYGGTKFVGEKLFVHANSYVGDRGIRFACVRYGNVVGSRGSVLPLFMKQRSQKKLTITDFKMTRFWITLNQGVRFVSNAIEKMEGGEIFIPKLPSMSLQDLVDQFAPDCTYEIIGIRPGEKLHESLISEDEARFTLEYENMYIVRTNLKMAASTKLDGGRKLPENFSYASNNSVKADLSNINELIAETA